MKQKLYLFTLVLLSQLLSYGQNFTSGGINYVVTSSTAPYTVAVGTHPNANGLVNVTIPETVENSGIIYSVTSIGNSAFNLCVGLTSVNISNSVTSIGHSAFRYTGLNSIIIPNSVTSIGVDAFEYCSSLTAVTLSNSLTSLGGNTYTNCTALTSIALPNSLTTIEADTFNGCSALTSVTIPNALTSINQNAFYGCSALTSITLPNTLTSIGQHAFFSCVNLTSLSFPNSLVSIGQSAFQSCEGLTSLNIPNSVTSIGIRAFRSCIGLTSVTVNWITPLVLPSSSSASIFGGVSTSNITLNVPIGTTAAYQATAIWQGFNIPNPAATHLNFDGVDDYIRSPGVTTQIISPTGETTTVNSFNFTNQMTVEFWMNSNTTPEQWDGLVTKGDDSWRVALTSAGKVAFTGTGAFTDFYSNTTVTDGNWHHVAATYNGTNAIIYIDGIQENSEPATANISSSNFAVAIGENLQQTGRFYTGNMDEVRIWNIARTASQISGSKNCELQGNEAGLVAYYKFNQGNSGANNSGLTSLLDSSASGNNGDFNGFALNGTSSNFLEGSVVTSGSTIPAAPMATTTIATCSANGTVTISNYNDALTYVSTPTGATVGVSGAVIGSAGTAYTFVATNSNGCSSNASSAITIPVQLAAPTVSASAAPTPSCLGSNVTLTGTTSDVMVTNGFTGSLAPSNWILNNYTTNGAVNILNAPNSIIIGANAAVPGVQGQTEYQITIPSNGTMSFNWNYLNSFASSSIYPLTFNNDVVEPLTGYNNSGASSQLGAMTVSVVAGTVFRFAIFTQDFNNNNGFLTISNLVYTINPSVNWSTTNGTLVGAINGLTATASTAGTYTLTATAPNGCVATSDVVVTYLTVDIPVVTTPIIFTQGTTANSLTATTGANGTGLLWYTTATGGTGSTTAPIPSTVSAGSTSYWVASNNDNGCESERVEVVVVIENVLTVTAASQTNVTCFGTATGSATVNEAINGTAPYTYDWTGNPTGDGTTTISELSAGTYVCIVTDALGNMAMQSFTITQPFSLIAIGNVYQPISCFGGNDGGASIQAFGGVEPYTYQWSSGQTTAIVPTGLAAGVYQGTVTDANGCSEQINVLLENPEPFEATIVVNNHVSCFGGSNAVATVNINEDEETVTYLWSNGQTSKTISGLTAGNYSVNVTFENGCITTASVTITQPVLLQITAASQTNIACFGTATGSITLNPATGGTAPYTYDWTGNPTGDGTTTISGLTVGTYACTVTDAKECTVSSQTFGITQPAQLTPPTTSNQTLCNGLSVADLVPYANATIKWFADANSTIPLNNATLLVSGATYYVGSTNANGCQSSRAASTVTLTAGPATPTIAGATTPNFADIILSATGECQEAGGLYLYKGVSNGKNKYESAFYSPSKLAYDSNNSKWVLYINTVDNVIFENSTTNNDLFPPATGWVGQSFCETSVLTITAVEYSQKSCEGSNASILEPAPSDMINWFDNGGFPVFANDQLQAGIYYVAAVDANGCESPRTAVSFSYLPKPVAPFVAGGTSDSSIIVSITGDCEDNSGYYYVNDILNNKNYYEGPFDSVIVFNGVNWVIKNDVGEVIYENLNVPTGFVAPSTGWTPTIYCTGTMNVIFRVTEQTLCPGATAADIVATGTNLVYFDDNLQPIPSTTVLTDTQYRVATVGANGCLSEEIYVSISIEVPAVVYPTSIAFDSGLNIVTSGDCTYPIPSGPYQFVEVDANGKSTYINDGNGNSFISFDDVIQKWKFSDVNGTIYFYNDDTLGLIAPATGWYPVDCQDSSLDLITYTKFAQSFCGNATVADLTATGSNYNWYYNPSGGTPLESTQPLLNNQQYYVSTRGIGGCESPRRRLDVKVVNSPIASTQTFCGNTTVENLVATGQDLKWYADNATTDFLQNIASVSTGIYYVSQTVGSCETPRTAVNIIVTPQPITPSGDASQSLPETSATIANIVVSPNNVIWYATENDALEGENALVPETIVTTGSTYYAVNVNSGCSSTPFAVTITVTLATNSFDTSNFSYYPNPTSNVINVEYSKVIQQASVFNIVGQLLFDSYPNDTKVQLDLSNLPSASYFIRVKSDGKEKTIKVIRN